MIRMCFPMASLRAGGVREVTTFAQRASPKRQPIRRDTATLPVGARGSAAMFPSDAERPLDNPIWSCLSTRHAHVALGGPLARRYPADISSLTGLPGSGPGTIAALETLVEIGDDIGIFGPEVPALPSTWETSEATDIS